MADPPPSGPHSDLTGANRDARAGAPNRDAGQGAAGATDAADKESKARPDEKP